MKLRKIYAILVLFLVAGLAIGCSDKDNGTKPTKPKDFVRVPGGSFMMGDSHNVSWGDMEKPVHEVTVSAFYIDKFELRQSSWNEVMAENPSTFVDDNKPVDGVSWFTAIEYCNRRSVVDGRKPCYSFADQGTDPDKWNFDKEEEKIDQKFICDFTANGYRLLTEAEWEYAATAAGAESDSLYIGSNDAGKVAWANEDYETGGTHVVGQKAPNGLNLHDMAGNVLEWCWDVYYDYTEESQVDPETSVSEENDFRILKGAGWMNPYEDCRASCRLGSSAKDNYSTFGFRIGYREN